MKVRTLNCKTRLVQGVGAPEPQPAARQSLLGAYLFLLSLSVLGGGMVLSNDERTRRFGVLIGLVSTTLQGVLTASRL